MDSILLAAHRVALKFPRNGSYSAFLNMFLKEHPETNVLFGSAKKTPGRYTITIETPATATLEPSKHQQQLNEAWELYLGSFTAQDIHEQTGIPLATISTLTKFSGLSSPNFVWSSPPEKVFSWGKFAMSAQIKPHRDASTVTMRLNSSANRLKKVQLYAFPEKQSFFSDMSEIVKRDSREVALRFFEAMLVARLQPFAPHTRHEDGRPIAQFPERNKLAAMLGVTEAEARFENETLTEGIKKLFPLWRPGEIKTVQVRTFRGGEQPISVYEKDVKLVTGEQELKFAKTRLAMMFPESPMALFYGLNETYQNKE